MARKARRAGSVRCASLVRRGRRGLRDGTDWTVYLGTGARRADGVFRASKEMTVSPVYLALPDLW
jgi:hypothetical protein